MCVSRKVANNIINSVFYKWVQTVEIQDFLRGLKLNSDLLSNFVV